MKTKPQNPAAEILAAHALATLPDSLARRRELLRAVVATLPHKHRERGAAVMMLTHLQEHDRWQATFSFAK
jgi:hypothetical protein